MNRALKENLPPTPDSKKRMLAACLSLGLLAVEAGHAHPPQPRVEIRVTKWRTCDVDEVSISCASIPAKLDSMKVNPDDFILVKGGPKKVVSKVIEALGEAGFRNILAFYEAYPTSAAKMPGQAAACTALEKRIAKLHPETGLVGGPGWSCDFANYDDKNWFLIALRSDRKVGGTPCNGINCSNLVGWYAVNRHTGAIHDWEMGEYKVGPALANE